ncbi:MAG: FecR domain-containing protein [Flavihumibacter sp.]
MDNSKQYDELLTRYLTGHLNTDEEAQVERWLADEANRAYFEALKSAWRLAQIGHSSGQINVEEEWQHFRQNTRQSTVPLEKKTGEAGKGRRLYVAAAVAALLLLAAGFGWLFFDGGRRSKPVAQKPPSDTAQVFVTHEVLNETGRDKNISLSDGSVVVLHDGSVVRYAEPFLQKRTIDLTGSAFFKVAKVKPAPFTVVSREIATTAIGTEFTVTAFKEAEVLRVRLHEGKVVVKPVDDADPKMKKEVYLSPGQELLYNYKTGVTVGNFGKASRGRSAGSSRRSLADSPDIPGNVNGSWYMFNNQSLDQVFISLSALYQVKILYKQKDVEKIYFTGKYDKTESPETILRRIGAVNKLTITRNDTAFIVTK